jgi:hypothetical protein
MCIIADDAPAKSTSFKISPALMLIPRPARAGFPAISLRKDHDSLTSFLGRSVENLRTPWAKTGRKCFRIAAECAQAVAPAAAPKKL